MTKYNTITAIAIFIALISAFAAGFGIFSDFGTPLLALNLLLRV